MWKKWLLSLGIVLCTTSGFAATQKAILWDGVSGTEKGTATNPLQVQLSGTVNVTNLTVNNTISTPASVNLQIANSTGTVTMLINQTNGRVGIGNTTPGYLLDVNGTANVVGDLKTLANIIIPSASSISTATNGLLSIANGTNVTKFSFNTTDGSMAVNSVSTNPYFDVVGPNTDNSIIARFYSSTGDRGSFVIKNGVGTSPTTFLGTAGATEELGIGVGGSEKIRINGTGSVGIKTVAPIATLDINGTARLASGPVAASALCLNATGIIKSCTSAVGADGICTCP